MSTGVTALGILQSGLIFSASMAWADAVSTTVKKFYPGNENKLIQAKLIYAVIVTVIVVLLFAGIVYTVHYIENNYETKENTTKENMVLRFAT